VNLRRPEDITNIKIETRASVIALETIRNYCKQAMYNRCMFNPDNVRCLMQIHTASGSGQATAPCNWRIDLLKKEAHKPTTAIRDQ